MSYRPLPSDFIDRPKLERCWINLLVLLRVRSVKTECCESFRKGNKHGQIVACKGCKTLYDTQSTSFIYRFLARHAKYRVAKK